MEKFSIQLRNPKEHGIILNKEREVYAMIKREHYLSEVRGFYNSDLIKIIWKEVRVAVLCGLTLSAANFIKLLFFDKLGITVAAVICLTLLMVVLIAKLVGCCLPMLASKLGFDPAVMASPFITTIVDALSLLVYFNIATTMLHLAA